MRDEGTGPLASHLRRALFLAATCVGLAFAACNGGGSPSASPTAAPTPATPGWTPTPVVTAEARDVVLGERASFFAADPEDAASSLAAGDFNGDGILDLALGASQADGPENGRPDAGEVYVFFGPISRGEARDAAAGEQDVIVYGADAGDQTGRALAAGDLNGDGIDDLVVGAHFGDGPGGSREDAGEAHVLFGSAELPPVIDLGSGGADVTVYGAEPGDLAAFALAIADVSGDGTADLVLSSFWADGPDNDRDQAGEVYVLFGAERLPSTIDLAEDPPDVTVYGSEAGDRLGESVAAGDVSGDGVADLVLPAPFASRAAGETYVIPGGSSLPSAVDIASEPQQTTVLGLGEGDQVGHSVAIGDVDGDGFGDLLLGAVSADGPDDTRNLAGEAFLTPGRALRAGTISATAGGEGVRFYGADSEDRLGRAVSLGDLNGDRLADLLLVATGSDGPDGSRGEAGELYVFLAPGELPQVVDLASLMADLTVVGDDADDTLGNGVFGRPSVLVVDADGDGMNDIAVSASGGDGPANDRTNAGEVSILFIEER